VQDPDRFMKTPSRVRSWGAVVVFLGLAATAIHLGVWQLGRADEKQALIDLRAKRTEPLEMGSTLLIWRTDRNAEDLDQQRVLITGRWRFDQSVALDNRAWEGRAGAHVLTPVVLADGSHVWVNRGWMPKPPGVNQVDIAAAPDPVRLQGMALASVMKRIELTRQDPTILPGNVWQNFDWQASGQRIGASVWPVIVWQTSDNNDGLLRKLPEVNSDVPKHLGYALQWFLIFLACLFFAWRLRPVRRQHDQ
jgi:surfeit locus 1 family protein